MRKLVNRFKKLKNERGLTLVELLAVIVILAIIAIIAFVFIGGVIENSRKDAHIANAQQIISAAKLYEASGNKIDANGVKVSQLQEEEILDQILDPWDKKPYNSVDAEKDAAKITKTDNGLKIVGFNSNEGQCNITATETDLSQKDRDTLCKNGGSGSGNGGD